MWTSSLSLAPFRFRRLPLALRARLLVAPDRALDARLNATAVSAAIACRCTRPVLRWASTGRPRVRARGAPLAHASSAYHLSGFEEKTAILGVDGKGEYATTFFGYGEHGRIHTLKEFYDPDSLSGVYGAMTEYLGFEMLDGEYKVMGMAPYGDAGRFDLSRLIRCNGAGFRVNTRYVNTVGLRRYKEDRVGFYFSPKLIEWLGPRRQGDAVDEPYVHYAAAMQQLFERHCLDLMETWLGDILRETGRLAFAGGGALNVKLNQRIVALPHVRELFVQPASGDAGTSLGAATLCRGTAQG